MTGAEVYMESNLSRAIDIASDRAKYDEIIKEILSDKQILARILKYTLDEFKDLDIDTIINNIQTKILPTLTKTRRRV